MFKGTLLLFLKKSFCWVSLCGCMCVMLEALDVKGLGGKCSHNRKQILLHGRNLGVSKEIV